MNKDCLTGSGTAAISHQQRAPPGWAVQMTHGTPSVASSHLSAWLQTTGTSPGVQLMTRHHQSCHHVTQRWRLTPDAASHIHTACEVTNAHVGLAMVRQAGSAASDTCSKQHAEGRSPMNHSCSAYISFIRSDMCHSTPCNPSPASNTWIYTAWYTKGMQVLSECTCDSLDQMGHKRAQQMKGSMHC